MLKRCGGKVVKQSFRTKIVVFDAMFDFSK